MLTTAVLVGAAVFLGHRPASVTTPSWRGLVPLSLGMAWVGAGLPPLRLLALAVLVCAAWGLAVVARRARRRRRVAARRTEVQGFCEDLAAELAAGLPAGRALESVTGRWPRWSRAATAQRLGGDVPDVMRELAREPGAEDLRLVAAAWQLGRRSGAGLATTLTGVATSIREGQATRRVVQSELASARATARLVAGLPFLTLALGSGAGGSPFGFLLLTPVGLACLATGLVLALAGLAWIEAIAAGVDGP